jgi:hypothetical protein
MGGLRKKEVRRSWLCLLRFYFTKEGKKRTWQDLKKSFQYRIIF